MIPYALKNGEPVGIAAAQRGLACGCVCPSCGARLMAKKGAAKAHHFSHYRMEECPHALETSLHLAAKAILQETRRIRMPALYLHGIQKPLAGEKDQFFDQVTLENHLGNIVPDIVLEKAGKKILVEIAVTHQVDPPKLYKLKKLNLPVLEVDAASIYREVLGLGHADAPEAFARKLVGQTQHKKWLFHPWKQALEYRIRQAADRKKVRINERTQQFTVEGCPLNKRFWRRGPMEGKAYAHLWRDCYFCPYCFEIGYKTAQVGYRETARAPEWVYCRANLGEDPLAEGF